MPSLLDIGKLSRTVNIRGVEVEVGGLSGTTFLHLLDKFPELRKVMGGGNREIDPQILIAQVPGAVVAAIASGCGYDPMKYKADPAQSRKEYDDALDMINSLSLGEQVEILTTIWELTFPKGIQRFIDALEKLASEVVGAPGKGPVTKSPEQSSP